MREAGQLVPILVRPHPDAPGRYQIAYGHRRRDAAAELGRKVRAVVRTLTDAELVVAQGKENAERRNLSFIERALFAAHLEARGFDRRTLNAALGVHSAEMSRLLAVAAAVPARVIHAIGPAPKAGRPRWMELAANLEHVGADAVMDEVLKRTDFHSLGTDGRFDAVFSALRGTAERDAAEVILNARGEAVIRIEHTARGLRFSVEARFAPDLGSFVHRALPELVRRYDQIEHDTASD
jgi:ParB family chromosome partitioning protein